MFGVVTYEEYDSRECVCISSIYSVGTFFRSKPIGRRMGMNEKETTKRRKEEERSSICTIQERERERWEEWVVEWEVEKIGKER